MESVQRPNGYVRGLPPVPSPRHSPTLPRHRTRRLSAASKKLHERQDFFRRYSPLGSRSDIFSGQTPEKQTANKPQPRPFILDPTGRRAYYWLGIVAVAVVYYMWTIIFRLSFCDVQRWLLWLILDTLFYAVLLLDVWMQMRTSYLRDGILQEDLQKTRAQYVRTRHFKLDTLAVIPLDWLYMLVMRCPAPAALQCLKLLKIYRLRHFFNRTESRSHFPNTCRVLFLIHNLLVIIHWNACIYFLLSQWIGVGSDRWVYVDWNDPQNNAEWGSLLRKYVYSFYWSTLTLTTIGELPQPQTNVEFMFVTFDYLVGILMFATLVGNVGSIIANMHKNRTKFQSKMDHIKHYMKQTKVPNHLQERVIKWFDYLWTHGHPVDDQQALNALPDKLKAEIGIYVYFETLKKVELFEDCEQGLLWELVLRLRTQVYSPGEYVCRKGDVGKEMYIVNNGRLEVMAEEDGRVLRELMHGEYFGEISVLNLGKSQHRRTAFVRSVGYSDLLCLSQADLLDVLKEFPDVKEMLVKKGKKKLMMDGQRDQEEQQEYNKLHPVEEEEEEKSADSSLTEQDELPPLQLRSVADQVIDVHLRLSQMEGLLHTLLKEVQSDRRKNNDSLPTISRRKISSQI